MRYCLKLATTSSAVIVLPLWNLTPRRSWNVQTVPSGVRLPACREPRLHLQCRVRERQILARDTRQTQRARFSELIRLETRAEPEHPDAKRAARLRGDRRGEREVRLADVAQKQADRPGAEAEHAGTSEELLPIEVAFDQLVDEVVLDWAGVVSPELLDQPSRLAIHPAFSPFAHARCSRPPIASSW